MSPETFLVLLAYVCFGRFNLGLEKSTGRVALNLNDGIGLEYYHILLLALTYIVVLSLLLRFKIHKMTTEEL